MEIYALGFIIIFMWAMWWETRQRLETIQNKIENSWDQILTEQKIQNNFLIQTWRTVLRHSLENSKDTEEKKYTDDDIQEKLDIWEHYNLGKTEEEWEGTTTERLLVIRHNHEYKNRGNSS